MIFFPLKSPNWYSGVALILNKRNKLYYHRNKCDNEEDRDAITKDIILVTDILKKVKKEIKLCDVIYNNVPKMKEQIKEVEDKEQEKEQKQKKKSTSMFPEWQEH